MFHSPALLLHCFQFPGNDYPVHKIIRCILRPSLPLSSSILLPPQYSLFLSPQPSSLQKDGHWWGPHQMMSWAEHEETEQGLTWSHLGHILKWGHKWGVGGSELKALPASPTAQLWPHQIHVHCFDFSILPRHSNIKGRVCLMSLPLLQKAACGRKEFCKSTVSELFTHTQFHVLAILTCISYHYYASDLVFRSMEPPVWKQKSILNIHF